MKEFEFEAAIAKHSDMVLRIAMSSLNNFADAHDVTQDVFLKLYQQNSFQDEEHLKKWLIRVTYNASKDLHRKFYRKDRNIEDMEPYSFDKNPNSIIDELSKLSREEGVLVYLHYIEGYSYKEIAKLLSKNANTIASKIRRALKKLNMILKEEE